MKKNRAIFFAAFMAGIAIWLAAAPAAADAAAILRDVEERMIGTLAPKDMTADMTMTIRGNGSKVRQLKAWTKNNIGRDDWRVMKFSSPADIRDLGFLVLAEKEMYLYLPEFHRTRRIASSSRNDSFVGSDFSYDDLGTAAFSSSYDPKLAGEDATGWKLELLRKQGADKPYTRIVLQVAKESLMPVRIEMYDGSGNLWKVEEQTNQKIANYWVMATVTMTDRKKGSSTILEFKNVKTDQNLGEEIFSERFLKRPVD